MFVIMRYKPGSRAFILLFSVLAFAVSTLCTPARAALGLTDNLPDKPGKASRSMQLVLTRLAAQRDEAIAIQRELVSHPALNPEVGGHGEDEKARWIESWLRSKGLPPCERLDSIDMRVPSKIRPNLIMRYPGTTEQTLWIVGHLDVSPPGSEELWQGSPWALRRDGDDLYGRGVEDNHQSITAGLLLLEALAKERATPPLGLGLLFTAGGKQGGFPRKYGLAHVLAARPDIFKPGDLIVVNDYGNSSGSIIEVAEKGLLQLKITVSGKQTHAALPHQGRNALFSGARFIADLEQLGTSFSKINSLFIPDVSTFSVTKVAEGTGNINQIPGQFVFYLDCRFMAGYSAEQIENAVQSLAVTAEKRDGVTILAERLNAVPAMPSTIPTATVVLALRQAVVEELKVEPQLIGIGAVTMAAELRAKGLQVAVWANADSLGDAVDERIAIFSLLKSAQVFARMLYYQEHPYMGQKETGNSENTRRQADKE